MVSHVATIKNGLCLSRNKIILVTVLDDIKEDDRGFTRFIYYNGDLNNGTWGNRDYPDWHSVNIGITSYNMRVLLDEEGRVLFFNADRKNDIELQIPDAGVFRKGAKGYGYVTKIRAIGEGIYVCGDNRQVYRFYPAGDDLSKGEFRHFDQGMLRTPIEAPNKTGNNKIDNKAFDEWLKNENSIAFWDIAGKSENDIYAIGDQVWHYNGKKWQHIPLPVTDETMFAIKIINHDRVLIGGKNGYLFHGNYINGFVNLSSIEDNQTITGIEVFNNVIYIASSHGLFTWDNNKRKLIRYKTNLEVDLQDVHQLEAKDGILWSFGYKDLAYFDGKNWTRIQHPDNPKIG